MRAEFTPERISIEKLDGTVVAERRAPRDSRQQAAELSQQAKAIQQAIGCSNIGGMLEQTSQSLLPLTMP